MRFKRVSRERNYRRRDGKKKEQVKVYRTVVRPAMMYCLEMLAIGRRQEAELEAVELKMLKFSLRVTRIDRIRNEVVKETTQTRRLGEKTREARLKWFGHVQRRDRGYIGRRMLEMELPGRRQTGRPQRRFMGAVSS